MKTRIDTIYDLINAVNYQLQQDKEMAQKQLETLELVNVQLQKKVDDLQLKNKEIQAVMKHHER